MSAFLLVFNGEASWLWALGQFTLPALLGNIVGGTALFALIAYAQVMKEMSANRAVNAASADGLSFGGILRSAAIEKGRAGG
jgi:hypothetical protein